MWIMHAAYGLCTLTCMNRHASTVGMTHQQDGARARLGEGEKGLGFWDGDCKGTCTE